MPDDVEVSPQWAQGLALLQSWVQENGDADVPQRCRYRGLPLGRWVNKNRQRREQLTHTQAKALEELPGWSWNARQDRWADQLDALEDYLETHQRMPPRGEMVDALPLGEWMYEQRRRHRQGRLPVERALELEAVPGFSWLPAPRAGNPKLAAPRTRENDRSRAGRSLRQLVEADERLCRAQKAPRIHRFEDPDPARGLVVLVSGDYHAPQGAFTLVLGHRHHWMDLAAAIDRVYARTDPYRGRFIFTPERRLYRESWPSWGGMEATTIELPWDFWNLTSTSGACADQDSAGGAVASFLAPGHAGTYAFDGWWWCHSIRVLRWTVPEEDEQASGGPPLLAVYPGCDLPPQYDGGKAPTLDHFLSLDSLQVSGE
ncbi:helicase associated domain-containing protein [Streptacidiphilus sp. EB103A]|uniref:helicase associated domain-containing protein n=1 Tax=Streptacidiphilus sp. EB103A TaxID=3156275 RepID=UPI003513C8E2